MGWRAYSPLATFSAGVAVHELHQSPSSTFANADAALYLAKQRGRDQLVVHQRMKAGGTLSAASRQNS